MTFQIGEHTFEAPDLITAVCQAFAEAQQLQRQGLGREARELHLSACMRLSNAGKPHAPQPQLPQLPRVRVIPSKASAARRKRVDAWICNEPGTPEQ